MKIIEEIGLQVSLDLNSSIWQDKFGRFKLQMKALDNSYINLLGFVFDNIENTESAAQYLVIFLYLAERKTVKINVEKKMEKINQLI